MPTLTGERGMTGERPTDAGHEAVGQALLVTVAGAGALTAASLGLMVLGGLERLLAVWSALT
ncbi:hypothetical protein LWF15_05790 [Kineosporia rhizophila]|uniref:hypothetical protein n=1 Tax=Kineosporia TaxID=49184 RepID=UPI001E49FCAC|nr:MULTISPECIES: hypothetical protein [Kineosporia]MCE0535015.1 hypothetical protein [Kineosporia rhizophila]GLY14701.1 hypothetical protein Kisp01_17160 [Kineosporia sp. NBRC 101677]